MSRDYPRFMFHHSEAPRIVNTEDEEKALGPEWSRIVNPEPAAVKTKSEPKPEPKPKPEPEPEPEPEVPDEDEENDEDEEDSIAKREPAEVAAHPPVPKKRAPVRPPTRGKARKK